MKTLELRNVELPRTSTPFCFDSFSANLTRLDLSQTGMASCSAYGVLGKASNLTFLSLSKNSLSEFPPWLRQLHFLEILDVSYNPLRGGIPSWIGELGTLRAFLASNASLEGGVPSFLANLSCLDMVDLSQNALSGPLPGKLIGKVMYCDLSWNSFSGWLPSSSMANWSNIRYVDLSHNNIFGTIPDTVGNMTQLHHLGLSNNRLTGCIPSSVGQLLQLGLELGKQDNDNYDPSKLHFELQRLPGLDLANNLFSNKCTVPQSLGNLQYLEALDLSNNSLHGSIPSSLGNITKLSLLDVSGNNLFGNIPPSFKNLSGLILLRASRNFLSGSLHVFLNAHFSQTLQLLDLSHNEFNGSMLPTKGNFPKVCRLRYLDLSHNELSGALPQSISNCNKMSWLILSDNSFRGEIPSAIGSLTSLQTLLLRNNSLVGKISPALENCVAMALLDLSYNQLTGEIPAWMTRLQVLLLNNNRFEGSIPRNLTHDRATSLLAVLDLSCNQLSGNMPDSFDGLVGMKALTLDATMVYYLNKFIYLSRAYAVDDVTFLIGERQISQQTLNVFFAVIDMSGNCLQGDIPPAIGALQGVLFLNLSHNFLSGAIPSSLGNLSNLQSLDLSHNQLDGCIPPNLATSLFYLVLLNLSSNHLQGPIPSGAQFMTFNASSYADNPGLCGFPLPEQGCRGEVLRCNTIINDHPRPSAAANLLSKFSEHVSLPGLAISHTSAFLLTSILLKFFPNWRKIMTSKWKTIYT